ncbi:MAG: tetratricopeptide repeat protein, partial [Bacteroidota bacterium]|nr:tetratricopeptide repeat protein [Bacteroidota bacterium]MDX5430711.1 tetratricopeptide repeat protein [Bacteroidota bacterium]MDX5469458.1 tetratricopeptide repeat protein [Bacteroidota bacterium]
MKATIAARIFSLTLLLLSISACDKNRNTFLNRKYQNMVAHFNIYFNGQQKLDETRFTLEKAHVDDFTKVLDVYPYGSEDNRKAQAGNMDEVIKKASRVIAERPISKWIDDSYFMMGQAYFFKADYFAAIETFQFLNSQYKGSRISYEATLWIIRSYVLLGKSKDAEAIIGLLNNDPNFPKKLKAELHEVSAYVQIREEKYKIAAQNMEKALPLAKGSYKKARYHYILGQLYDQLGEREKARYHFRIVTKGTPPYEMAFNAKINLARNYDPNNPAEIRSAKRYLKSMLKDDKNINYFSQIYFELGVIERKEGDLNLAIDYFKQSNDVNKGNSDLKAKSFLQMADIYFSKPNYRSAQIYYDSAVYFLKPEFPDYDKLKAKQEVLSELIKNLILIQREDSLLRVAELPLKEIDKLVEKAIEDEKKRVEEAKKREAEKKQVTTNPNIPSNPFQQPGGGDFYFSDPIQVARGYSDFVSRYGERSNVDNWLFESLANKQTTSNDEGGEETNGESENQPENKPNFGTDSAGMVKQLYTKDIPFTPESKSASLDRIAEAYLKVGEIYFEKLKDLPESEKAFNQFLKRFEKHDQVPKALFYLYKIKKENNESDLANSYKAKLISEHPNSTYAKYLTQDPSQRQKLEEGIDPKIIAHYQLAYTYYKGGNYREVVKQKLAFDRDYFGTPIQPKFDLFEALAFGRMDSVDRCILLLEQIVANYPTSAEALEAQKIITAHKSKVQEEGLEAVTNVPYVFNPEGKHYFIMVMPESKSISMNQIKVRYSDFNLRQLPGQSYAIEELLVGSRQILIVKEFKDKNAAAKY